MMHPVSEPCPFGDHPVGIAAPCCSFRGKDAALYLLALGQTEFALPLLHDMDRDEAARFARDLRQGMARFRITLKKSMHGAGASGTPSLDGAGIEVPGLGWKFALSDAMKCVEAAADWYESVSGKGFGVHAWF